MSVWVYGFPSYPLILLHPYTQHIHLDISQRPITHHRQRSACRYLVISIVYCPCPVDRFVCSRNCHRVRYIVRPIGQLPCAGVCTPRNAPCVQYAILIGRVGVMYLDRATGRQGRLEYNRHAARTTVIRAVTAGDWLREQFRPPLIGNRGYIAPAGSYLCQTDMEGIRIGKGRIFGND